MKTMIIYASMTGHTKKIAHAMGEQLGITPVNFNEKPSLENVDLLLIGSGIYGAKPSQEFVQFVETLSKENIRNVVLFSTCTSGDNKLQGIRKLLVAKGISVNEKVFVCKGQFLLFSLKHPKPADLQQARNFAADIASQYKGGNK